MRSSQRAQRPAGLRGRSVLYLKAWLLAFVLGAPAQAFSAGITFADAAAIARFIGGALAWGVMIGLVFTVSIRVFTSTNAGSN